MKLLGATANLRPWTAAERAALRARYIAEGPLPLVRDLGRSRGAVMHQAARMGLLRRRPWTAADARTLALLWGELTVRGIARRMGRTPLAVYWHAREQGLKCGAPQGHVYLSHAAARAGYETDQLRRILKWAGVAVRRAMARPDVSFRSGRRFHFVDPFDADQAVAAWHRTETVESASRRHGVSNDAIARWLMDAHAAGARDVPPKPERRRAHWRVPSAVIDRVVAQRMAVYGKRRAA